MASAPPAAEHTVSAVTAVWNYVGELVFNLLVLAGAIKASDRIVKEMMGLSVRTKSWYTESKKNREDDIT